MLEELRAGLVENKILKHKPDWPNHVSWMETGDLQNKLYLTNQEEFENYEDFLEVF